MWIFDFFSGPHSFNGKKKESGRFKRCWIYNGHLEAGFKKEWDTLEEVVFILRKTLKQMDIILKRS